MDHHIRNGNGDKNMPEGMPPMAWAEPRQMKHHPPCGAVSQLFQMLLR